jgi:two-component system response regulator AtoC
MERAVLLSEGPVVLPESLPEKLWRPKAATGAGAPLGGGDAQSLAPGLFRDLSLKRASRELEEAFIRAALRQTRGNRTRAAELLEISHRALLYKVKEYGVDPDSEAERG